MIDLHTHTNESDGTLSPQQLVEEAAAIGLEALAITDHDTFAGYDKAVPHARAVGLDLVCGIELSTKLNGKTVHLLGYWVKEPPTNGFRTWILDLQESRRDRNRRLIARLRSLGLDLTLEEVEARGRNMTGRPHFAKVMVEKGCVPTLQAAFDEYLDESAKGYVDRTEPQLREGIDRIQGSGGIASIAHPVRIGKLTPEQSKVLVGEMKEAGLAAIEVYHSDHRPEDERLYLDLAAHYGLEITGGSDFHGEIKPGVLLGTGPGTLSIPRSVLDRLRER